MPERLNLFEDARRQLTVCNSCRYCEGYCAVFPALERLNHVTDGNAVFLANLCHDCRACYQACPYTPPHELKINIPAVLSEVRSTTYSGYAWPRRLAGLAARAGVSTVALAVLGVLLSLAAIAGTGGLTRFWSADSGAGSFYRVIPYLILAASGMAASVYIVVVMAVGSIRFWKDVGGSRSEASDRGAWMAALRDVATMVNLKGGGSDCYQPSPLEPSDARRMLHQAVLYGFALAFVSTALAALYQDILGWEPPYPFWSAPVITGSIGGALMAIGCTGLLWLKAQSLKNARALISRQMASMDNAFIVVLDVAAITGMLTLVFRGTGAMAAMLTLHLASLVALYATAPYGKFVHSVYRFLALLKNRAEQRREHQQSAENFARP
jgi:citrate/tricarballylate utilization protein